MEYLKCRFCELEVKKGWNSRECRSGMDMLMIHIRLKHSPEWNQIRKHSLQKSELEYQLVNITGAFTATKK